MTQIEPDTTVDAHEWECAKCGYVVRSELGPVCCERGTCAICHQEVEYHGHKQVLRSQLGVTRTK